MTDTTLRLANVAMLLKVETTEGADASPTAADAFPFEEDGYSYNYPYRSEASNEANGSLAAGAPLVVGQPAEVSIRVRLKGANAGYTASVKPPHHALLSIAGLRGQFTAAVASAALTAGTTTSGTLGTGFGSTAQMYRGMPLIMTGGVGAGQVPYVSDYSAAKVATLTDQFGSVLTTATSTAIPANWTYAPTSPGSAAARATDHPSGTLYIYEDGTLHKFVGCRAVLDEGAADTAKPLFATFKLSGVYAGKSDAAIPSGISLPSQIAPTLVQGLSNLSPAFLVNRAQLPIAKMSLRLNGAIDSPEDPNTNYGFGYGQIGGRTAELSADPLATLLATRDALAAIAAGSQFPAVARFGTVANNRIGITFPLLTQVDAQPGARGRFRSEDLKWQALNPGQDANTRDNDFVICFS